MSTLNACKDVLILQTGGTIDKSYPQYPGAYGFEIGQPAVEGILQRVMPSFPFRIDSICAKDSQEITDADREDILRYVVEADQQLVLITHGTDSMCQTARYLVRAGVGQGIDFGPGVGEKKVVITGAFKPECMKDSDADFNVGFALGALQIAPCSGVWVAMRGALIPGAYVVRTDTGDFVDERDFVPLQ
ncbi:L-asparaginase [Plakobranchus ocellatus]|uniref:L-asparaginase n=1 Tax=Plakobranchus ocellatus TaxID=259542 RepID=A0AAV4BDM4_9GAST|nr:L-asparaginase [Plakobranchus ocellatus]